MVSGNFIVGCLTVFLSIFESQLMNQREYGDVSLVWFTEFVVKKDLDHNKKTIKLLKALNFDLVAVI